MSIQSEKIKELVLRREEARKGDGVIGSAVAAGILPGFLG